MFHLSHFAGISRFFRTVSSARGGLYSARPAWAALAFGLATMSPLAGAVPYVDPADVLGIWDFNSVAVATQAADLMQGTPMVYQASTAFSADAGGRSGLAGDRAVNFGTVAGNSARIGDAAFMALLNQSIALHDKLSVVFWQKWSTSKFICPTAMAPCTSTPPAVVKVPPNAYPPGLPAFSQVSIGSNGTTSP
jgi:hypothetical protein